MHAWYILHERKRGGTDDDRQHKTRETCQHILVWYPRRYIEKKADQRDTQIVPRPVKPLFPTRVSFLFSPWSSFLREKK